MELKFLILAISAVMSLNCVNGCTVNADCNNGACQAGVCVCTAGFVSYQNGTCNYQQKEKLTAFLLSFLVGTTGADWFYLSQGNGAYITAGVFKLLTGVLGIFAPCCMCCFGFMRSDKAKIGGFLVISIGMVLMAIAQSAWYLADWIRILMNSFKDGNGVALKSW
jgi:hypothetical protein